MAVTPSTMSPLGAAAPGFTLPDPRTGVFEVPPDQIPQDILELDGQRVRIKGHLLPERFDVGRKSEI